jgi:diaminopimelate decarboxylase
MFDSLASVLSKFGRQDGELTVGGRKVSDLVRQHGAPLYLYDGSFLRKRHDQMRAALPAGLLITYAVKANPNLDILRVMGPLYDGIDIASGGEMAKALEAGIPAAKMSFAGPGKNPDELAFAIDKGIGTISIESERELDHIERICKETGKPGSVMIRVNPSFELTKSGLKMGGGSKQFGIDSERVPDVIKRLKAQSAVAFKGVHIFAGTQNLSIESILEAYRKVLEYARDLRAETGTDFPILNLGGGFGIPYFKGDQELDLTALGEAIGALLGEFRPALPGTRFKIELGRYLVGESGIYLAKVLYKKLSRGATFLVMDGGMHHHLPASGNMNQSPIRRLMHVTVANRLDAPLERVNLVGSLCTPLDNFGLNMELPKADEGDLIAVLNSGAYGYSISPLDFLSHRRPKEVLI